MSNTLEPRYDVVWPLSRKAGDVVAAAHRLPDLNGKTVCELWDGIFRGELIFPALRAHLQRRYPDVKFVDASAFGDFYGPRAASVMAELPDKLRAHGVDAAIVGIGA